MLTARGFFLAWCEPLNDLFFNFIIALFWFFFLWQRSILFVGYLYCHYYVVCATVSKPPACLSFKGVEYKLFSFNTRAKNYIKKNYVRELQCVNDLFLQYQQASQPLSFIMGGGVPFEPKLIGFSYLLIYKCLK